MKVVIATPTYDGFKGPFVGSLVPALKILAKVGVDYDFYTRVGDSAVGRSRDTLVAHFLASEATDLVFIDSDLGFDPSAVMRLLQHDVDVVGGCYLKKQADKEYACDLLLKNGKPIKKGNLFKAIMVPGGFLRIRRNVFESLKDSVSRYDVNGMTVYGFFEEYIKDGRFVREDVAFCRRYRAAGGEIYLEPNINFDHVGEYHWSSNFKEDIGV